MYINDDFSVDTFTQGFDIYHKDGEWLSTVDDPDMVMRGYFSEDEYLYHRESGKRAEVVHVSGGGTGGAEDCKTVIKIGEDYYQINYFYFSHHGYCYDCSSIVKVKPVEVTVTQYQEI